MNPTVLEFSKQVQRRMPFRSAAFQAADEASADGGEMGDRMRFGMPRRLKRLGRVLFEGREKEKSLNRLYRCLAAGSLIQELMGKIRDFDSDTYTHSVNVAFYSLLLAKWLRLGEKEMLMAFQCGLLHDYGKLLIPEPIIKKPSKLTKEEYEEIKAHTMLGYRMLLPVPELAAPVKDTILLHHERLDRSGYPFGVVTTHLFARIVAIADVYDAMVSDRPYKKGVAPEEVFRYFSDEGKTLFDPDFSSVFCENMARMTVYSEEEPAIRRTLEGSQDMAATDMGLPFPAAEYAVCEAAVDHPGFPEYGCFPGC